MNPTSHAVLDLIQYEKFTQPLSAADIISHASVLRKSGQYRAVIEYVEVNRLLVDDDDLLDVILQGFYAAVDGKYTADMLRYAREVIALAPSLAGFRELIQSASNH